MTKIEGQGGGWDEGGIDMTKEYTVEEMIEIREKIIKEGGKMSKMLHFVCRGDEFVVDKKRRMMQAKRFRDGEEFSGGWIFLGVSKHHWRRGIDVDCKEGFEKPESLVGGYVWDRDYGIVRVWAGQYEGKIPKITKAWVGKGGRHGEVCDSFHRTTRD